MEIDQKNIDNVQLVSVSGRIDAVTSKDLETVLDRLIDQDNRRIIVNFSGVEYISSAGLRVLIAALKRLRMVGGDLKLVSLRPIVREVFEITGFTKLFSVYLDEKEAMETFNS